jgi:hypothetical protein
MIGSCIVLRDRLVPVTGLTSSIGLRKEQTMGNRKIQQEYQALVVIRIRPSQKAQHARLIPFIH